MPQFSPKQIAALGAQVAFMAAAAFGVFSFVRAAQADHRLTNCTALCELHPAYAGTNLAAPDFELPDLDGKLWRLSSLRDKPVVLNFWQKDCVECMREMPDLAEFASSTNAYHVVTVSVDEQRQDILDALKVSLKGKPPPFPVLLDPEMKVVKELYGTSLYPETWLIDEKGIIRVRIDGRREWSSDALVLGVLEMIDRPSGCAVEMVRGYAVGPLAPLCGDSGPICQPNARDDQCRACLKQSCCGEIQACGTDASCRCRAQCRDAECVDGCGEPGLTTARFGTCTRDRCAAACAGALPGI